MRFILIIIVTMILGCQSHYNRYEFYKHDEYNDVRLDKISDLVNSSLEEIGGTVSKKVNVDLILMGKHWRRRYNSNIFFNNGWTVQIERGVVKGWFYINSIPSGDSMRNNLETTDYIVFNISLVDGNYIVDEFDRIVSVSF